MRRWITHVVTAIGLVAPIVLTALWWSRLPDPIAAHWGVSGAPDGSAPRWLFAVLPLVIVGPVLAAPLFARSRPSLRSGLATALGLIIGSTSAMALRANLDARTWRQADHIEVAGALAVAAVGLVGTGLLYRALPSPASEARRPGSASIGLGPGERAVFTATVRSDLLLAVGVVFAGAGLAAFGAGRRVLGLTLLVAGAACALFAAVRVRVGENGLDIRFAAGYPRVQIPLTDIVSAEAEHIEPLQWGGWGYRGSILLMKRAAVVLRRGDGLVLTLTDARTFAVTMPRAAEAAGLINDLLRRR